MAKRKAAKKALVAPEREKREGGTAGGTKATPSVEPMVIALAEQLGSFLGRAQKKADGWMENEALRQQLSLIRDGASDLLKQVNRAGAAIKLAAPKRQGREGESVVRPAPAKKRKAKASAKSVKGRSGGAVDATGKRHRKPPPQELFDPRLGEPMGKQMGQKSLKRRGRG